MKAAVWYCKKNVIVMAPCQEVDIMFTPCVIALDGEREVEIKKDQKATIHLSTNGPLVVDVERTMTIAMQDKILAPDYIDKKGTV